MVGDESGRHPGRCRQHDPVGGQAIGVGGHDPPVPVTLEPDHALASPDPRSELVDQRVDDAAVAADDTVEDRSGGGCLGGVDLSSQGSAQ